VSAALVTAWSYSRYNDYKTCPLMFKLKHIDKIKPPGSAAMDRGSDIHKLGENYLKAPTPKVPVEYKHFDKQMKELAALNPRVELQLGFTDQWTKATASARDPHGWFAKDTWLRIVCDVDVRYDDHTADIIDFKTGKKYDTNEEQVELFSCAPFMEDPQMTAVTTRLWYLDQPKDNEVIREYTRKDFEAIKKDWAKRVRPMFNDRRFAPKPNPKCRYCHFRAENGGPCKF
jgi:CRISPR/Cas system-associated exonuclease Cas4 (RecB family)